MVERPSAMRLHVDERMLSGMTGRPRARAGVGSAVTLISGILFGWSLSSLLHAKTPSLVQQIDGPKNPRAALVSKTDPRPSLLHLDPPERSFPHEQPRFKPELLPSNQSQSLRLDYAQTEEGNTERCRHLLARTGMAGWNADRNEFEDLRCHQRLSLLRTAATRARVERESAWEDARRKQVYRVLASPARFLHTRVIPAHFCLVGRPSAPAAHSEANRASTRIAVFPTGASGLPGLWAKSSSARILVRSASTSPEAVMRASPASSFVASICLPF